MKICETVRSTAAKSRHVTLGGSEYVFEPVQDDTGKVHFCAEVKDKVHQRVFLANPAYYELGKARMRRATAPAAESDDDTDREADDAPSIEASAEAQELIELSVRDLSAAVGGVSSIDVIRQALALEQSSESPRKTVVKLLEDTLEGAQQAGVS